MAKREDVAIAAPRGVQLPGGISVGARYAITVLLVVAALIGRLLLDPWLDGGAVLLLFTPAVMVSAVLWGFGPGMVATALSVFAGTVFVLDPVDRDILAEPHGVLCVSIFVLTGVVISSLAGRLHRAEDAVRASEDHYRHAVELNPQIPWTADPEGNIIEFSQRWMDLTGLSREQSRDRGWLRALHPDDVGRTVEAVNRALRTGEPYDVEHRFRKPDGSYRWMRSRALPRLDGQGRIILWYGTTEDIHLRKLAEAELRQAKEEAEAASEAKSQFLATLSHELRTPLTPVLLTVSLLESHPGISPELREDLAGIRRNVELESRLISDLLDLTRVVRGKLHMDEQDVDLHLIIRSAIHICQRDSSARLEVDLHAEHYVVRGDSTRLHQVFWNLVCNAIKFTPPDGTIVVRSEDVPGNGRVRVEVTDTGRGIDQSVLPRLFRPFEQGDVRTMRQQAGLGLGLAISKRLVEAHGGTITASSRGAGQGATFTVVLPTVATTLATQETGPTPEARRGDAQASQGATATAPEGAAPPSAAGVAEGTAAGGGTGGLRILLVEDHEPTLRILAKLVRAMGHRVTPATTLASAQAAAEHEPFDLILSDLGLPDGSGLDLMRRVRDRYAGRAIALTGYGMESDVAASHEAGFALHLTKPVDLPGLRAAIDRVAGTGDCGRAGECPERMVDGTHE